MRIATGGVGSIAVSMLAGKGYEVVASTGKADQADWLRGLGRSRDLVGYLDGEGSRYDVFLVTPAVSGITWEEFKDEVLIYNPDLEADSYIFLADKQYLLPQN